MPKKLPKISIITPSFNQKDYIEDTIKSVLSQNYPNLEYIIIDGGSSDGTLDILNKYRKSVIINSQKDNGQTDAINKGFKKATGDILAYLNSDDLYLPGAFLSVVAAFGKTDKLWLCGKCRIIDENGKIMRNFITQWKNIWLLNNLEKNLKVNILRILNYIPQPAVFWRRPAWEKIGPFDESLKFTMDYDFWLRLFSISHLDVINREIAAFRIHKQAKGVMYTDKQLLEGYSVMSRYTDSASIKLFHKLHDAMTKFIYTYLNAI